MSNKHKDYTRYSNQVKVEEVPAVIEVTPVVEEAVAPEEPIEVLTPNAQKEAVYGIVENCKMLNVREAASTHAKIISVIAAGNVVEIIENESTEDFYKVRVDNEKFGFNGFCMKDYIRLV